MTATTLPLGLLNAFWARVDTSAGPDGCWPFSGSHHPYGRLHYRYRMHYAHRIALTIKLGRPIADGMLACHTCDNPPCVNPAHLFEATNHENLLDSARKGRKSGLAGVVGKLTPEQVADIRAGGEARSLAQTFGVSVRTVHRVRRGDTYPPVPEGAVAS